MQQTPGSSRRALRRRAVSLLLALALTLGLVPGFPGASGGASAHWADPYLSQLVEWGFIRADQAGSPDRALTRADFMAIVNRAYGYRVPGPTPFTDVDEKDWYYDDVGIAYTARYINGTSPTTASPNATLDRETATTILGRNMMLQESAGEILDFTDARRISTWAQGTIKSSLEHYLVSGYDDGTFRPQRAVSWGEMAALISRTVGTPLQEAGDYSLGGVFGNVTVTSPGVTLRDTVITGDLYITGGVGLGGIKLENVTVLGRIIASGTGASEGGASILLRNVTADELLVDNLQDNEVSIRADGITEIGKTTVRTSAYIEDNTPDGLGLHMISLEGDSYGEGEEVPEGWTPPRLTLAGRVEEVVNRTPNSIVHAAKGTVAKLTVDEEAVGSQVVIDRGTVVKNLILDTGVSVTGEGDVTRLEVNAPGCNVAMVPDEIEIRPGITAVIAGEEMDSMSAEEFSLEPLILSGYPRAKNVAPTSLEAVFSTNKKGIIHWAVSTITDGSVGVDDLLEPPAYGSIALRYGTLTSPRGNEETMARISGLTPDGSYYLSAVLEDARGQISPLKVISFTTPDNTVPAFAQGYPHMSNTSRRESIAVVMPTKDCKLYYALLPQAATAPTASELKAGTVSGALGYGVQDVYKNVESTFRINDRVLEEQTTYTAYFWLTDVNGANSSAVIPLTFTTADETPPTFVMGPLVGKAQDTSVPITFRLSEDGTVFWAVVPEGEIYPQAEVGQSGAAPLDSLHAKVQVASGQGALLSGKTTATATADGNFTISGLEPEKSYDLYYVAQDKAGNYSVTVGKMTISTRDATGPVVKLLSTESFKVSSAIVFEFSENVKPDTSGPVSQDLLSLYRATLTAADKEQAKKNLRDALTYCIDLYQRSQGTGAGDVLLKSRSYPYDASTDWGIDFSQAVVSPAKDGSGKIEVTIPATGHQLQSAGTYFFRVHNLTDNAGNRLRGNLAEVDYNTDPKWGHEMPPFTVVFAEVFLAESERPLPAQLPVVGNDTINPDAVFRMVPKTTSSVVEGRSYDLLLFTNTTMRFELYYRVVDTSKPATVKENGKDVPNPDRYPTQTAKYAENMPGVASATPLGDYGWVKLGTDSGLIYNGDTTGKTKVGVSLMAQFNNCNSGTFPELKKLDDSGNVYYEFAIRVVQKGDDGLDKKDSWGGGAEMDIYVAAATPTSMEKLTASRNAITETAWKQYRDKGLTASDGAVSIATTESTNHWLALNIPFPNTGYPKFDSDTPKIIAEDTYAKIDLCADQACKIYYVIAPIKGGINTTVQQGNAGGFKNEELLEKNNPEVTDEETGQTARKPYGGPYIPTGTGPNDPNRILGVGDPEYDWVTSPSRRNVWQPPYSNPDYKTPSVPDPDDPSKMLKYIPYPGGNSTWPLTVTGLKAETDYFAYFVLESETTARPSKVYVYTFRTKAISNPKIRLDREGTGVVNVRTDKNSNLRWVMYAEQDLKRINTLWEPLTEHLADDYSATSSEIAPYKDYTVFDALCKPATLDYSVFDLYGKKDTKDEIFALIGTGSTVGGTTSIGGGKIPIELEKSSIESIDNRYEGTGNRRTEIMKPGTQYIVLTMACHENGDEEDVAQHSFKAIDNVFVPDSDTPVVTSLSTSITGYDSKNGTYSGTFSIQFSKPLYWTPDGATAWDVRTTTPAAFGEAVAPDGSGYIQMMNHISGSAWKYLYFDAGSRHTSPQTSYTISFRDMPSNVDLTLFSSGDVANMSAGRKQNATLTIHFTAYPDRANERVSGFTGTWDNGNIASIALSTIPPSSSEGGDIDILFLKTGTDNTDLVSTNPPTLRLKVGDKATVKATLNPEPATKIIYWSDASSTGNSVATVADNNSVTATITAEAVGVTTVTINVQYAGSSKPAYKSIQVFVTDDKLDVTLPESTSGDTVSIERDSETGSIIWTRKTGTRPSETITLNRSEADMKNVQVEWAGDGSVVTATKISNTSAKITVVGPGTGKITITVKVGSTVIQTKEIEIKVEGSDTQAIAAGKNPF